jgi:hypothetical protein
MVMTRTTILTLADSIAHGKGDDSMMQDSYDQFLDDLARTSAPFVADATYTPTDGTAEYSYASTAVKLLAVFHGAVQLPLATARELEAYDEDWRATGATTGTPVVYSFSDRDARKFLLWPTPDTTAASGGTIIYGENRTTDIPVWLALPIVFQILAEEFSYPSQWQDKAMAEVCGQMAKILKEFTGI